MANYQTICRKGTFDSAHRVMNERFKCFNLHGHTYHYELIFSFFAIQEIGYAIDFKEIKRLGCAWIDDMFDHGVILNPADTVVIQASKEVKSKIWLMSLNGEGEYCNPSVENIVKELFLGIDYLFKALLEQSRGAEKGLSLRQTGLHLSKVRLWETPNCLTDCQFVSTPETENFLKAHKAALEEYVTKKGLEEYDDRKIAGAKEAGAGEESLSTELKTQ